MMFLKPETAARNMSPERNYLVRLALAPLVLSEETSIDIESGESDAVVSKNVCVPSVPPDDHVTPNLTAFDLEINAKESIGRGSNKEIPEYLKATIAAIAVSGESSQTEIAKEFNVAQSTVSNFANGLDNSRLPDDNLQNIVKRVDSSRNGIENEALKKTMMTLGLLTESDVMCLGAKDKSVVASNLSKVAANMRDRNVNVNDNRVQLVINSPQVRQDYHYAEVEV